MARVARLHAGCAGYSGGCNLVKYCFYLQTFVAPGARDIRRSHLNKIDLHSHSTFSDGTLAPDELIARAAQRGVTTLSLTDHDDTGGLAFARAAAQRHGLSFVDGVEISVTWHGQTIHIVGLGIDPENLQLQAGLAATRAGRAERADKMVAALDRLGIAGSREGARQFAGNPQMIGRTHFARFLVKQGIVKDVKGAFKRLLGNSQPCHVPHQWASLRDAVEWITGSGGLAVLAHPGRYSLDTRQLRVLLSEFRNLGGAALEVVTGSHKPHHCTAFAAISREFGLAASSGSDFHSPAESFHDLGSLPDLPHGCEPVWERLESRC